MRSPSWFLSLAMAGCALVTQPGAVRASEIRAYTSIPRIAFSNIGPQLTQDLWVTAQTSMLAIDVRAPRCTRAVFNVERVASGDCGTDAGATRAMTPPDASVTLMLPQWQRGAPLVDFTLRSFRDRSDAVSGGSGASVDVEVTQVLGRNEWSAGYSHPVSHAGVPAWRVTWIGTSLRLANGFTLQAKAETAREAQTNTRDIRYTLQATRAIDATFRVRAFVTRAPDDPDRGWRAGVGVDWQF